MEKDNAFSLRSGVMEGYLPPLWRSYSVKLGKQEKEKAYILENKTQNCYRWYDCLQRKIPKNRFRATINSNRI